MRLLPRRFASTHVFASLLAVAFLLGSLLLPAAQAQPSESTSTLESSSSNLFTPIDAGLTGVINGSSSLGDVNGDGALDLVITGEDANENLTTTLYLGDGDGGFTDAQAGLTGVRFSSSSLGDVNGDGIQDLVITGEDANGNYHTARLYLGDGDGGFSDAQAGLTGVVQGSSSLGDVNGDGNLDLVITGYDGNDGTATVYLGDGDGGFTDAQAGLTGVRFDSSSSLGDVNGDGTLDLVITGRDANNDRTATLYLGDGDGGFTDAQAGLTGVRYSSSSLGDVNGDDNPDLVITGRRATNGDPSTIMYINNGSSEVLPPPPEDLTATPGDSQIDLSWTAGNAPGVGGYNVYRSTSTFNDVGNATQVNGSLVTETSFTDDGVANGTTYFYRVTAVDTEGNESELSNEARATLQTIELLGIEVNQSVQDLNNSIPLVEGKRTFVRIHVQSTTDETTPVDIRLIGTRNGSQLNESPDEFESDNFEAPLYSEDLSELKERRADYSKSLTFQIPTSWVQGEVTFSLAGDGISCTSIPSIADGCQESITVDFNPVPTPKITVFTVGNENILPHPDTDFEFVKKILGKGIPFLSREFALGEK